MGIYFTDQFSLLHFATGIVAYFWRFSFLSWFILHLVYELFTNTKIGITFINRYTFWPGGKLDFDSTLNIVGDQFWGLFGWVFAYLFVFIFFQGKLSDKYN